MDAQKITRMESLVRKLCYVKAPKVTWSNALMPELWSGKGALRSCLRLLQVLIACVVLLTFAQNVPVFKDAWGLHAGVLDWQSRGLEALGSHAAKAF